jgi:hypothetical protein
MPIEDPRFLGDPAFLQRRIDENAIQSAASKHYDYVRGIVKEVISNPAEWLKRPAGKNPKPTNADTLIFGKIKDFIDPAANNYEIARYMPANSILCYVNETGGRRSSVDKPYIAFPFFPPHIALPLKPGEHVWLLREVIGEDITVFYWMSRVSTYRQVDDINYTCFDRIESVSQAFKELDNSSSKKAYTNSINVSSAFNKMTNSVLPARVDNDKICASSYAYLKEFTGEIVPRHFKECGDLLLQGSNNASIQLGTEKFSKFENFDQELMTNVSVSNHKANMRYTMAGALDITVGREKSRLKEFLDAPSKKLESLTGEEKLNAVLGTRLEGAQSLEYYELDKLAELKGEKENESEGENSPRNVYSRLYMSMNSTPDESFELRNSGNEGEFPYMTGASLVGYSDNIRMFAEKNLRLSNVNAEDENVFSMIEMSEEGNITIQTGVGADAAKIILKTDGNIIIKPGVNGLVHLGGDESDTTLSVCGVPTTKSGGTASPDSITSSLGGELFRSGNPDAHLPPLNDVIASLVSLSGPSGAPTPTTDVTPSPDGTASSKVVIKG